MLSPSDPSLSPSDRVDHVASLADAPSIASVLESTDPAVRAFLQVAVAHQQATEAAAAGVSAPSTVPVDFTKANEIKLPLSELASVSEVTAMASESTPTTIHVDMSSLPHTVPEEILQSLIPTVTSTPLVSVAEQAADQILATASLPTSTLVSTAALTSLPITASNAAHTSIITPAVTSTPNSIIATSTTFTTSTVTTAPVSPSAVTTPLLTPTSTVAVKIGTPASTTSTASSSTPAVATSRPFVSTKRFNPDDIFCLGCCRNLSVDHYTCPNTNRVFKSCNACRQKSRINSKKVTKPATMPTKPTISMEEFGTKLRELEASQEETSLDVMVRLEGSVEMDPETLKARGAQIAAQVYESTGYWFSHSRTNDETQSKTRLKIYGCSQREDRRAPPALKTQSRKRNRPSTKSYFPCKGNLTMTFYHNMNHVRVVYGHKRHAKYDNRKCPDHVRAFVKENLSLPPRQLFDTLLEANPGLGITQAQIRYWSHYYKKNMDQDGSSGESKNKASSAIVGEAVATPDASMTNGSCLGESTEQNTASHITGLIEPTSQDQLLQQQADEERNRNEQVHQILLASDVAALQSLAQSHHVGASLVGADGSIAISVPMTDLDTSPLTSSIVQRVLSENGKGLLDLQASLRAVSEATAAATAAASGLQASLRAVSQAASAATTSASAINDVEGDAVVQQVRAFMKENDQQQQRLLEQQQQQEMKEEQL
ncbi:hypothetical protein BCR41DRAFT_361303 [Lobosporangium transversale]|uniref:Uncharacterized protein n=1 Tax=Lobosporangium transversale TaxID=64571 RepID=A0A1Y2GD36_9FUNG|nr:hypothetical protein BCR41DRAFT_361303 [Lobosporangium transversale]ORZ06151.1 hypothetical protein BCR41DRAFT_361303 [Lobosporangium transversale]|eukprot:XP_021877420.1 hypothetical protein BCR41DRAFT_361303 [Lobosporangium transversale]